MNRTLLLAVLILVISSVVHCPGAARAGQGDYLQITPRVLGGQGTDIKQWPWTVALVRSSADDAFRGQFCGGTLIAGRWVLTAAHCLTDSAGYLRFGQGDLDVVVGRTNLLTREGDRIPASGYYIHPGYALNPGHDSDLALIYLLREPRSDAVWAAIPVIPENDPDNLTSPGLTAWITGWGSLGPGKPFPASLRKARLPLVSQDELHQAYPWPTYTVTCNMIGAGPGDGSVDSCQGDSGGPLMVQDHDGSFILAGVTSWGEQCGTPDVYGVYVRLANYCQWIKGLAGVGECLPEKKKSGSSGGCTVTGQQSPGVEWLLILVFLLWTAKRRIISSLWPTRWQQRPGFRK